MVPRIESAVPPGLTVRTLALADADSYFDLTRRAADYSQTYDGGLPSLDDLVADMGTTPPGTSLDNKVLVGVFRGTALIAYLDLLIGFPDEATWYLGLLLIAESERGHGLGQAIVAAVDHAAATAEIERLMIEVYDANSAGRRFWTRQGFQDEQHFPDYTNPAGQPQPVTRLVAPVNPADPSS